jgi:hypothetical protein
MYSNVTRTDAKVGEWKRRRCWHKTRPHHAKSFLCTPHAQPEATADSAPPLPPRTPPPVYDVVRALVTRSSWQITDRSVLCVRVKGWGHRGGT